VDAREFPGVQPETAALLTLIYLHLFHLGKPAAVENLVLAARTNTRFRRRGGPVRGLPNCVQRGGGATVHASQFVGIEPDAATAAVTHIEGHASRAFFAQRLFASRTFHIVLKFGPQDRANFQVLGFPLLHIFKHAHPSE
jgi:hypothetical protein